MVKLLEMQVRRKSSEELENSNVKGVGRDRRRFKRDRVHVKVDVSEAENEASIAGEWTVPDGTVGGGLLAGCFEAKDDFFTKGCSHEKSEGEEI